METHPSCVIGTVRKLNTQRNNLRFCGPGTQVKSCYVFTLGVGEENSVKTMSVTRSSKAHSTARAVKELFERIVLEIPTTQFCFSSFSYPACRRTHPSENHPKAAARLESENILYDVAKLADAQTSVSVSAAEIGKHCSP